jgi:hypothetical protein
MKATLPLACTLALACTPALAPASAAASDASSTHAYVRANYRLVQTAARKIPSGEAAIASLLRRIRQECPGAASAGPQNSQSTQLSNEVIGAMVTTAMDSDLPSIRQFIHAAGGLRWSSGSLTRAVRSYVGKLKTLISLHPPDVCADIRSWAASGYQQLPAATTAFDARFMPSWVALGELPAGLSRHESAADRSLARTSGQRESRLGDFEAREVENWGRIMNALELYP